MLLENNTERWIHITVILKGELDPYFPGDYYHYFWSSYLLTKTWTGYLSPKILPHPWPQQKKAPHAGAWEGWSSNTLDPLLAAGFFLLCKKLIFVHFKVLSPKHPALHTGAGEACFRWSSEAAAGTLPALGPHTTVGPVARLVTGYL